MESHTISESLDCAKTVNLETEADVIHSSPHQGGKCSCLDNNLIVFLSYIYPTIKGCVRV